MPELPVQRRAEYGAQTIATVGRQLETRYGRGFGEKNVRRTVQFAAVFPEAEIAAALRRGSATSSLPTPARWNSTGAGWTAMNAIPMKHRHSASSCVRGRSQRRSNTLTSISAASTSPTT